MSKSRRRYLNSEKGILTNKIVSDKIKKIWENPEYKARLHIAKKNWWLTASDEQKEKRIKGIKGLIPGPRMKRTKFINNQSLV